MTEEQDIAVGVLELETTSLLRSLRKGVTGEQYRYDPDRELNLGIRQRRYSGTCY
jgi:hypothetical protein